MNKQLADILDKEVSRKEFFTTMGIGIASLLGFANVLRLLNNKPTHNQTQSNGYGSSGYGR